MYSCSLEQFFRCPRPLPLYYVVIVWNALALLFDNPWWLRLHERRRRRLTFCPIVIADWNEEAVSSAEILRMIYQGRFLHGNVTLAALGLPTGKTTVMHLVPRESLPEPNSQGKCTKNTWKRIKVVSERKSSVAFYARWLPVRPWQQNVKHRHSYICNRL